MSKYDAIRNQKNLVIITRIFSYVACLSWIFVFVMKIMPGYKDNYSYTDTKIRTQVCSWGINRIRKTYLLLP